MFRCITEISPLAEAITYIRYFSHWSYKIPDQNHLRKSKFMLAHNTVYHTVKACWWEYLQLCHQEHKTVGHIVLELGNREMSSCFPYLQSSWPLSVEWCHKHSGKLFSLQFYLSEITPINFCLLGNCKLHQLAN